MGGKPLTSDTNFRAAIGCFHVWLALIAATGAFIFGYVMTQSAPKPAPRASRGGTLAAPSARAQ